jgi:hypothetical protein
VASGVDKSLNDFGVYEEEEEEEKEEAVVEIFPDDYYYEEDNLVKVEDFLY